MKDFVYALIYIHAAFGGIGLMTGIAAIVLKKGSLMHRRMGRIFSCAMTTSAVLSIIIAWCPGHKNLFLFLIGVFTIYMILSGNRALTFKAQVKNHAELKDQLISGGMLLASSIMVITGITQWMQQKQQGILYIFFGGFGLLLSIQDFRMFKTFKNDGTIRLGSHIGRMVGALIASVTAFLVAGLQVVTIWAWISPTLLGTAYIIFWNRKIRPGKLRQA